MTKIPFYLSVCDTKTFVELDGKKFPAGYRGEVNIKHSVKDDILYMDLHWCGHKPSVGNASDIEAISIRVCPDRISTIAIYKEFRKNHEGCCFNCSNGCSVYGYSSCSCDN